MITINRFHSRFKSTTIISRSTSESIHFPFFNPATLNSLSPKMYHQLLWLMLSVVNFHPNAANDLKRSLNDFSLNFLKGYHENEKKHNNLLYSPISLASALSLVLAGSNGETQQEIVNLLGFNRLMKNHSLESALKKVNSFLDTILLFFSF